MSSNMLFLDSSYRKGACLPYAGCFEKDIRKPEEQHKVDEHKAPREVGKRNDALA